ncbi:MAG: threonine synthase [Prolixibacteraceae bacterium]|nr:threonine synthase [Prolixibacteraceae bacterium]
MIYYSTNKSTPAVTLKEAVVKGLAADKGLFMPEKINKFDKDFLENMDKLSFREIAFETARKFFSEDVPDDKLKEIVYDTLPFDCPVVKVKDNIYSLELFHGPTLAFKDIGARFMARLLNYFLSGNDEVVNVLVATSGDTGSAVANGFLNVPGIRVFVLYPKGKVTAIQESQFTTLGQNITALEVDGVFDDCQRLVKRAFLDEEINKRMMLTSANSINVARFMPQAFYYVNGVARLKKLGVKGERVVVSVPSGNFGNLTAGLIAREMGLPVEQFLAANNANDVVYEYLQTGVYNPRNSVETIANAMDVGDPSNFARILDLFGHSHERIFEVIKGYHYSDDEIKATIKKVYKDTGYLCDPHGACGFQALEDHLQDGQAGLFLETAHPAKFIETVESVIGKDILHIPGKLKAFMEGEKKSIPMANDYGKFREFLLNA